MSLLRSMAAGVVLSVLWVGSAQAVLITETWQSTITYINHNVFNVNDMFNWTVTYDNSSLRMHDYNDGANTRSDHGANDDILNSTYCTGSEAYGIGCTNNAVQYSVFADAIFDISAFHGVMEASGMTGRDGKNLNVNWRWTEPGYEYATYQNDDVIFDVTHGQTLYFTDDGASRITDTRYTSVIISTELASVPEPASIALMGFGLVGLGFARRKKAA